MAFRTIWLILGLSIATTKGPQVPYIDVIPKDLKEILVSPTSNKKYPNKDDIYYILWQDTSSHLSDNKEQTESPPDTVSLENLQLTPGTSQIIELSNGEYVPIWLDREPEITSQGVLRIKIENKKYYIRWETTLDLYEGIAAWIKKIWHKEGKIYFNIPMKIDEWKYAGYYYEYIIPIPETAFQRIISQLLHEKKMTLQKTRWENDIPYIGDIIKQLDDKEIIYFNINEQTNTTAPLIRDIVNLWYKYAPFISITIELTEEKPKLKEK